MALANLLCGESSMEIQVNYIGPMLSGGLPRRERVELEDSSCLNDLLARMDTLHDGAFSSLALDSAGRLLSQVKILLDGKDVETCDSMDMSLASAREVTIVFFTAITGG